ncbi:hypothetical protein ACHAPJ_006830 [Fusarium lateritium]
MKTSATMAMAAFAPLSMALFLDIPGQPSRRDHHLPGKDGLFDAAEQFKGFNRHGVTKESKTEIIIIWANPGAGAATTTINEKVTVTQTVTAGAGGDAAATKPAEAQQHTVTVGGPGGLTYQPEELPNIPIGDTVVFEFLSQNHTVSQSAFDTPCDPLEGGMDSGFMPNPNNTVSPPPQVAMQVMVDTPLWFYCKQGNHCGQGMVFSINPSAEKTQAKFKELAIKQKGDGAQTPITGGGSAAPPAESKPAGTQPAATQPTEEAAQPPATDAAKAPDVVPGKGTIGSDGSCVCMVSCSAGSFPAAQAQGINSFGGMGGALPMNLDGMS